MTAARSAPVRPGITDGSSTAIEPLEPAGGGRMIGEGLEVIAGVTHGTQSTAASPFQGSPPQGPPRPGGF